MTVEERVGGGLRNICKQNWEEGGGLKKITLHGGKKGNFSEYCIIFLQPTPMFNQ